MKSVVHQSLGHIIHAHPGGGGDGTKVEDALVGHSSTIARIEHRKMGAETHGHIVGRQDGHRSGVT